MIGAIKFTIIFLLGVISASQEENKDGNVGDPSKVLSRRKRFIVFPDGSSFQFVYCTENQGYLQLGDIVWFGNTAALAWQLPTDPKIFHMFKHHDKLHEAQNRNGISKTIYYLDEDKKVLTKMPYSKRLIVNPAFAKRSIPNNGGKNLSLAIKQLHGTHKSNYFLKTLDQDSITFHREGRKSFYEKFEIFLKGLGWRGRDCVLRMLCETGRGKIAQGTFLQEIMRAAFTLPHGQKFDTEYHNEYDKAYFNVHDCAKMYPHCDNLYN